MNQSLWRTAVERAGRLAAPLALDELSDADLLARYLSARDESMFAAIVRRHGPLVWGVCRGLSGSEADAEDAFQATFLAFFRAASKVRHPNALGAWLHRVAGRVCRNGMRAKARRARRERLAAKVEASQPTTESAWDRWHEALHAEIDRLPDTLRVPFVLCVLQGMRQGEAAKRLGWKLGTVSGRVCKAKQALTAAIGRRGLTGPAAVTVLAGGMCATPLTAGLVARGSVVVQSAMGSGVSTTVHELARGAMGVSMSKMKLFAGFLLAGAMTIGAVGTRYPGTADAQSAPAGPPPGPGVGGGAPGFPGLPPGPPSPPPPSKSGTGGSGGNLSSFGQMPSVKIEYQFKPKPTADNGDKFKSLLTQLGNDGWEYVGVVPGQDELIFKRAHRPTMGGGMNFGNMPGVGGGGLGGMPGPGGGGPGATPRPGSGAGVGLPGGLGGGPGAMPPGGGFPGTPGAPGSPPGLPGGGDTTGGDAPGPGAARASSDTVELKVGETIRHRMNNHATIERVFAKDSKIAEVTPDPTNATRVLIKAISAGSSQIELTDGGGNKEKFTVRVK